MIYQYQQVTDEFATHRLNAPEGSSELATVDGITYVNIPDGLELPAEQPEQIAASIAPATVDVVLREEIKAACPHVWLINQRVAARIAERYSTSDEIKLLRTAPSAEFEVYNAFVEDCRAWGREQKAALGLA